MAMESPGQAGLGFGSSGRWRVGIASYAAVLVASSLGICASTASAAPKEACGLVPAPILASDLGLPHILESGATTPDTETGGRLTRCKITAWKGSKSNAGIASGRRARMNIETAEEDTGSPLAPNWAKGTAEAVRDTQESNLEEESEFGSGYYTRSTVGNALWNRKHADSLTYNTTQNGIRNIFATWRTSQPIGRSVTVNMYVDEFKHGFAEINKIAKAVVTAFANVPGEFGTPGPPAPEPRIPGPGLRFHSCPGAQAKGRGETYVNFIVEDTSCQTAVEVMRVWLGQGGGSHGGSGNVQGWGIEWAEEDGEVTGRKGRAQFVCVPKEP